MRSGRGLREEFAAFYAAAYPELAAQLLAITGDARVAKAATATTLATAWRSWPSLRQAGEPLVRARWMAVHAAAKHQAKSGGPGRQAQEIIGGTGEAAVVVAALQLLPPVQRRALVLHYMGGVSVNDMAALSGSAAEHIELLLDEGFTTLAETLVWADTAPQHDAVAHDAVPADAVARDTADAADGISGLDPADRRDEFDRRFDWTAEALADTAARMPEEVRVPSRAAVLRRAALVRWSARAVPAAVGAACVAVAVIIAARPDGASDLGRPTIYAQNDQGVGAPEQQAEPDLPPAAGAVAEHRIAPVVGLRSVALTSLLDPSAERRATTGTSRAGTGRALPRVVSAPAPSAVPLDPSAAGDPAATGSTTPGSTTPGSTTTRPPITTTTAPTADPPPVHPTPTTTTTTPPVATSKPVTTDPVTTDPVTMEPTTTDPTTTDPTTTERPTTRPTTTKDTTSAEHTTAGKPTKDDSGTGSGKSNSGKSNR